MSARYDREAGTCIRAILQLTRGQQSDELHSRTLPVNTMDIAREVDRLAERGVVTRMTETVCFCS